MSDTQLPLISIVLPCRNEAAALPFCLKQIKEVLQHHRINGEIIVSDSSSDASPDIARQHQVILVQHGRDGYGAAYLEGFKVARGQYLFLADADGTYDFREIPNFLKYLTAGYDLVIGNRFAGKIAPGAMPWTNRYLGNPVLSGLFRVFFNSRVRDIHCGMRAVNRTALGTLNLKTTGMEFASEMMVKAVKRKLKIKELPIDYNVRQGQSKLKPLVDAWRHLRFMLLYSPLFLFFVPGALMLVVGLVVLARLYFGPVAIFGFGFEYHWMFVASLFTVIGYQLIIFALFAKTYAVTHLGETSIILNKIHHVINIETGILASIMIAGGGVAFFLFIFWQWFIQDFGAINYIAESIIALTLVILGIQTASSAFMLSILGIKEQ